MLTCYFSLQVLCVSSNYCLLLWMCMLYGKICWKSKIFITFKVLLCSSTFSVKFIIYVHLLPFFTSSGFNSSNYSVNFCVNLLLGLGNRVVSLCMSPINDSFMSGSLDHTVRIWDLRVNACQVSLGKFLSLFSLWLWALLNL